MSGVEGNGISSALALDAVALVAAIDEAVMLNSLNATAPDPTTMTVLAPVLPGGGTAPATVWSLPH